MREKLKERFNSRTRFKGTFSKYSLKSSYKGLQKETILLLDVKNLQDEELTDHLWFNLTKGFRGLGLLFPGDIIYFDARVRPYVKGYVGRGEDNREIDYKLSHPTKIELFKRVITHEKMKDYYKICPYCGYHNNREELISCRRCGYRFIQPQSCSEFNTSKLEQTTLINIQKEMM